MKPTSSELLPGVDANIRDQLDLLRQVWMKLELDGDTGVTPWEVLVPLRDRVTACLRQTPPDIVGAESLTAQAFMLIQGIVDA